MTVRCVNTTRRMDVQGLAQSALLMIRVSRLCLYHVLAQQTKEGLIYGSFTLLNDNFMDLHYNDVLQNVWEITLAQLEIIEIVMKC